MELGNKPRIETIRGRAILPLLTDLQRLRVDVFRAWPYLYEGDQAVESDHLRAFAESPHAAIIVALADDRPVGASTCLPLADEAANVRAPFEARGWNLGRFCYFGESVLLPEWRGHGIGVAFFGAREAHARSIAGVEYSCFCGVERPLDHPLRPSDAVGLDAFWRRRGYAPAPGLFCTMEWKDVGSDELSDHRLNFWWKSLNGAPLP